MNSLKLTLAMLAIAATTFAQTDSTFYFLDKTTLTNNVLCNFGDSVYWGMFDGIKNTTLKNKHTIKIADDLKYYAFGANELPSAESLKINAATQIRQHNRIPLLMVHYEYTRIKSNAIVDTLLTIQDGKYYDVIPRSQSPYENKMLFMAAPVKDKIYAGSNSFYISRDFLLPTCPTLQAFK
ncbi:MAG: hypothetical protein IPJ79_16685 [Bacteroidetes bacterium]|nr:hypothetical protein [Bacteroidota bacterium]